MLEPDRVKSVVPDTLKATMPPVPALFLMTPSNVVVAAPPTVRVEVLAATEFKILTMEPGPLVSSDATVNA